MNKTVLYLTDNSIENWLAERCRDLLLSVTSGLQIVSISQDPIDFGYNICVGCIGRSGLSLAKQMLIGLEVVDTKWVAIAEHDCIYSKEHFQWTPLDDQHFWYNENVWLAQLKNIKNPEYNGLFSIIKPRWVQSQLICDTKNLLKAIKDKIEILQDPAWQKIYPRRSFGEPGAADPIRTLRMIRYDSTQHLKTKLSDYIYKYIGKPFNTKVPNIDIRHGNNFTNNRIGKCRRLKLEPWGTLKEILYGKEG